MLGGKLTNDDDNDKIAHEWQKHKNKFRERAQNDKQIKKNSPKSGKRIFQEINRNTLSKLNVV